MKIEELHAQALDYASAKYDQRLSHVMTEEQFGQYKTNDGHTYYIYLMNIIKALQPKKVLELGTSIGRSALFMMTTLPEGSSLTTLEKGSFMRVDLEPFFEDKRLSIVFGDDTEQGTYEPLSLKDIDFAYIDSEHEISHLEKEWAIYQHFLSDGAIVVMDDISLNEGMIDFWNRLPYEKISCPNHVHFSGFGVFQYRRGPVGVAVVPGFQDEPGPLTPGV